MELYEKDIETFLNYIGNEKRYSQHTFNAYKIDLLQFFSYIIEKFKINKINDLLLVHIRSWIVSLSENKYSTRAINRKISSLKSFFKFFFKRGQIKINIAEKITLLRQNKNLPEFVQEESMRRLFEYIDFGTDFEGLRDRLILEVFYLTGIRVSELVKIKNKDINAGKCTLLISGKRNKERLVPFPGYLIKTIAEYNRSRDEENLNNSGYLFVNKKGDKLYNRIIYNIVRKYLTMVTTQDKKSPHVLRHTFATHLLNNGADLAAIKDLLGHESLAATQIYTHNSFEQLKSIYKQAHPRANK